MISIIEAQPAATGPDLVAQVEEIFSPTGILSKAKNFEYRPQQQQMAVAVARALQHGEHLAVEAGTGVGKSLGYLVPSILFAVARNKKAIVSTHTINLQEQLIEKDLPMLERILPVKFSFTMLKGRGNYLCSRRLHKTMQQAAACLRRQRSRSCGAFTSGLKKRRTGACPISRPNPIPRCGHRCVPNAAFARPKSAASSRSSRSRTTRSAFFNARANAFSRRTCSF